MTNRAHSVKSKIVDRSRANSCRITSQPVADVLGVPSTSAVMIRVSILDDLARLEDDWKISQPCECLYSSEKMVVSAVMSAASCL